MVQSNENDDRWSISNRMSRYLRSCDITKDVDEIITHFTPTAVWEGVGKNVGFGRAVGHDQIRAHFSQVFDRQPFTLHYIANSIVDVNGDIGSGTWMCLEPTAIRMGTLPAWVGLDYAVEFSRVDDQWLITHLRVDTLFATPYHVGWVADRFTDMLAEEPHAEVGERRDEHAEG
ncbi:nuclear transport factor 2 family protein [Gordonia otitidis]|uniref:nuclear transport factor 2 family protein n=1 Tax=Gordonia otitidis TaxID=249058 RepID=UPI001D135E8B|nr:nuclear transport factor 2 family protein [Gordonia otitidis]UEA57998.1 nuclear transport factor 2 family protein [Gordonia otitidis]